MAGLCRVVRPILWRGATIVGLETVREGGKILRDIAENDSPDVRPRHIVSKHVNVSMQNLIGELQGRGRKRKKKKTTVKKRAVKNLSLQKRHLLIDIICFPTMFAETVSLSSDFDIFAPRPIQSSVVDTTEMTYKPSRPWTRAFWSFFFRPTMTRT